MGLWTGVQHAAAETRALVVGVSGYPRLAESLRLVGPKNDAREMANTLARLGVAAADITVLGDGLAGLGEGIDNPGPGTREAILSGLDRLADNARTGDLIVFYFSGHGSQQPDMSGDEEGGNDEIFLPYDVGSWTGKGVDNALLDDELNERVRRILDKGADFFGIIDACNSATGFRAVAADDVRVRAIDPAALGVPEAAGASRGVAARNSVPDGSRGRAAFFYAAQEIEEALEKTPKGAAPGESYGVFTHTLLARMNSTSGLTYRRLHQAVVADIKRNTLMATQTPELEGELLDEPVLGLGQAATSRFWPIFSGKLQAGSLEGLTVGSIVELHSDAAAAAAPIAYGVVETAGATRSVVAPTTWPCESDPATCAAAADPVAFKKARFARLSERGIDFGLTLSEPLRLDPQDGSDYGPALAALAEALGAKADGARIAVARSGYDVAVGLVDGTLAFSASGGSIDRYGAGSSPRLTLPADPAQAALTVSGAIDRMARAAALQRLAGGGAVSDLGLKTGILVRKSLSVPAAGEACSDDEQDYAPPAPAGGDPVFGDCDVLTIDMENAGRKPLDVTVLLVGADFSITPVWPSDGNANRIHIGEKRRADVLQMEPDPSSAVEERLVFLAVPGVNRAHVAFTDLEQEGLRAMPGEAGSAAEALRDLLTMGLHDMSRSTAVTPARLDEELVTDIRPFLVTKD